MIKFPEALPCAIREGYGMNTVSPLLRTEMQSGRARQRRRFSSTPTMVTVQWTMSDTQAQLFEAWYRDAISDGADWFEAPLKTPESPFGVRYYVARFTDIYDGPNLIAKSHWRYTAELELRERPVIKGGWGIYAPDYITYMSLFDRTINQTWPDSKYQTYMHVADTAINESWPDE